MKVAVIGGGISGLSIARMLTQEHEVVIFEADSRPGGLIKCDRVSGGLFHRTGGHVFNTKRQDVLNWFWANFDRETEFTRADRNAVVYMDGGLTVPYPIENHVSYFKDSIQKAIIADLIGIARSTGKPPENFEEFLVGRFGLTLYDLYFRPYNHKVWRTDLSKVSLSWLEGKLPMPSLQEILYNNFNRFEERSFVHSTFFYPRQNGSQFIADRLAMGLNIRYNSPVAGMQRIGDQWLIDNMGFDRVVFCGNVKQLPSMLGGQIDLGAFEKPISALDSHGTTTVFCQIARNPYSWVYMPSPSHSSHRIICTGNFADSNNSAGIMTASIEFTDEISMDDILANLKLLPFEPTYLAHRYEKYTYPIQDHSSREIFTALKDCLSSHGVHLLGRFAEWEYFNMDAAIGSALDLSRNAAFHRP